MIGVWSADLTVCTTMWYMNGMRNLSLNQIATLGGRLFLVFILLLFAGNSVVYSGQDSCRSGCQHCKVQEPKKTEYRDISCCSPQPETEARMSGMLPGSSEKKSSSCCLVTSCSDCLHPDEQLIIQKHSQQQLEKLVQFALQVRDGFSHGYAGRALVSPGKLFVRPPPSLYMINCVFLI